MGESLFLSLYFLTIICQNCAMRKVYDLVLNVMRCFLLFKKIIFGFTFKFIAYVFLSTLYKCFKEFFLAFIFLFMMLPFTQVLRPRTFSYFSFPFFHLISCQDQIIPLKTFQVSLMLLIFISPKALDPKICSPNHFFTKLL